MMSEIVVLVIDDDQSVHDAVDDVLLPDSVDEVVHAHAPGDGIRLAFEIRPTLVLLDINMPEIDGFKVCRALKENATTRDIPILCLTVETKADHIARALDCGAVDYVSKPFNDVELKARLRVALRAKDMIDMLREQARVDALTGLLNRAALDDALLGVASSHERNGQAACLMMMDLDHFKQINDRYGHGVGDDVLRRVGELLRKHSRPYDTVCRFGGDEFGVIFGQTEGAGALAAAQRILEALRATRVSAAGVEIGLTCSAGLVCTEPTPEFFEPADLMKAADAALYRAKNSGRDQLVAESFRGKDALND
jgi:diguanylate cyclase (GGDEF)-like protein